MDHTRGINDLLGQKLIFLSFKNARDVPYHSANIEKKRDIRDQHTLFYQFAKTMDEKMTKFFFERLGGTPGTKN